MNRTLRDAFDRWKDALIDQDKQTSQAVGFQPAEAGCQLIHATHSAPSQAKAVETSQALALRSDPLVPRLGAGLWILIHGCARTAHPPPFNSVSCLARFPAAYVLYQQQV